MANIRTSRYASQASREKAVAYAERIGLTAEALHESYMQHTLTETIDRFGLVSTHFLYILLDEWELPYKQGQHSGYTRSGRTTYERTTTERVKIEAQELPHGLTKEVLDDVADYLAPLIYQRVKSMWRADLYTAVDLVVSS